MISFHNAMLVLCAANLATAMPSNCERKYVGEESVDSVILPVIKVHEAHRELDIANSCAQIKLKSRVGSVVTACDDPQPPRLQVSPDGQRITIDRRENHYNTTSAIVQIRQFCG